MKPGQKWLLSIGCLLAAAAVTLFVAAVTLLPAFLQSKIVTAMEEMGLEDVRLEVSQVSLRRIDLARFSVGSDARLGVDHIRVAYDIPSIREGRVRRVEISGLTFEARLREGRLDLGPLDVLRDAMAAKEHGAMGGRDGSPPFEHLELQSARLWLDLDGERVLIPFDATIDADGSSFAVEITAFPLGSVLHAVGTMDASTTDLDLVLDATIGDLALWSRLVPPERLPGHPRGRVELSAHVRGAEDARDIEGHVKGAEIAWRGEQDGRQIAVNDVTVDLTGIHARQIGKEPPTVLGFDLAVAFPSVDIEGLPGFEGTATVHRDPGEEFLLAIDAHVRGNANDRVSVTARVHDPSAGEGAAGASGTIRATVGAETLRTLAPASSGLVLEPGDATGLELSATLKAEPSEDLQGWRVTATDGRMHADVGAARLLDRGAKMASARCDVSFSGAGDASGARLRFEAGSHLDIGATTMVDPGQEWSVTTTAAGGFAVALTQPLQIDVQRPATHPEVVVAVPGWSARLHGLTISHRTSGTRMDAVEVDLFGDAAVENESATGSLGPGSHMRVGELHSPALQLDRPLAASALLDIAFSEPARAWFARTAANPAWEVEVPALRVQVGESDVDLGDALLRKVALDWTFEARATPAGVWIASPRPGRLSVESGTLRTADAPIAFGAVQMDLDAPGERLAEFDRVDQTTRIKAGFRATAHDAVNLTSTLGVATIQSLVTEVQMSAKGLIPMGPQPDGEPPHGAEADAEEEIELQARFAVVASASTGDRSKPGISIDARTLGMEVVAHGGGSNWNPDALSWSADAKADLRPEGGPVRISGSGVQAELGTGSIAARVTAPAGQPPTIVGAISLSDASVRHDPKRLVVSDISAEIPFAMGTKLESAGRFEIATIWKGDDLIPGLAGTLSVEERRVDFGMEWPILDGITATASGWMEPGTGGPHGEVVFAIPRGRITETNQPADVFSALAGVKLGGTIALDGRIGIAGSRVDPRVTLHLDDVSVESKAWDIAADGVAASITLDQLTPMTTPGDQRISVRHAKLGKLEVNDGSLAFRVEGPKSVFIEQTAWSWAGGRLYAHAVRVDRSDPKIELVLYADHLQLQDLAELVAPGTIRGEGTLYGRLPVAIAWPQLSYGEAFLYAEPGLGRLQVLEMTGILEQLPAEARGALRDFEYTVIKAKLKVGGTATVRLRGTSRDPAFPREIILDINIYGIDGLLDAAIVVSRVPSGHKSR